MLKYSFLCSFITGNGFEIITFFICSTRVLNSRPPLACWAGVWPLELAPSPFVLSLFFWIRFHGYFAQAILDSDPLIYIFHVTGMTDIAHHALLIKWDEVLLTFRWLPTSILPLSGPWIAGITGMSNVTQPE
jgi:hypothetical protein